ncbi:MAG: SDR family NAD(P)-dependent oxidoreductase [Asgard group archaeon]|nr:SDR family NAD(P)-dependent oxidoreductase [Asgard group archaeon]
MVMNILVTGGCGFIGSNIVKALNEEGYNIKIIDDLSTGKKEHIQEIINSKQVSLIKGDIVNYSLMEQELQGVDIVIHEAAKPDVRASTEQIFRDFEVNVKGTVTILQAMITNNVPKIIFASSGGTVYGETTVLPTPENHPLAPISHYGASKAACEQYLSSYASLYDLEAISLRLGNIFGPPSDKGVMYDFFWKLKKTPEKLEILGNGKQVKSYLYVDDCVDAHLKAIDYSTKDHEAFNIATSEGITVNEIADEIVSAMNLTNVTYNYTGGERGWAGDVRKAISDISKAKEKLDWKPQIPIKKGLEKYVNWLKKQTKE